MKENKKRFKIHPYYIISIILLIVFIIILPWIIMKIQNKNRRLIWCRNACPDGIVVDIVDDGICDCGNNILIDLNEWKYNEVENEK